MTSTDARAAREADRPPRQTGLREIVLRKGARKPSLREARAPPRDATQAVVRTLLTGVDGTDEELLSGGRATMPEGEDHLVLGHEALAEVVEAPDGSGLEQGDLVVPLVRRGCGRCNRCLYGASDLCATGDYKEHGIKALHGFMRDVWAHDPRGLVRAPRELGDVAVMAEPLSVVVKALEEATRVQRRLPWFEEEGAWQGKRALVLGTGSLGSLAAFLLRDEDMEVWAADRSPGAAFPARLLARVGARHVNVRERGLAEVAREAGGFDLVVEATGAPSVMFDALPTLDENAVMCLLGVPPERKPFDVDGDDVMRRMVLGNRVLLGSVNSRRAHFEEAIERLRSFRGRWGEAIDDVVTHAFAPEDAEAAFAEDSDDLVKKVIDWRDAPRLRRPGQK